ncbi:MAG: extracellular solute-binding protein [Eubacteriales bacterium]
MKRKIIILLFAAVLMLSSCFGADKKDENTETENDAYKITFGFIGMQPASADPESASSRIHQKILNDFNIDIQVVTMNEDTWQEELDEMIANNTVPDVFFFEAVDDRLEYRKLIDLGMVRDIPKALWSKRENLAKVMSWYEGTYAVDGKMYFVPRTYQTFDQTHGSTYAILYRRDWAFVVGAIPVQNPHFYDVMNMFRAFVAKDPDENDVKDTWGITGGGDIEFIKHAFLEPFGVREWMREDNKWIPGLMSSEAKEAVAWISQLYKEGVIDPDFVNQSEEDALNKFITGKSGACLASVYPEQIKELEEKWTIYNSSAIGQSVDIIPLFYAPDGYLYNEVNTFSTGTMFSSRLSDEKMKKVLDFMDWMYTEEGRMYFQYGEETTDYSIVLGEIVTRSNPDEEPVFFGDTNIEYKPLENLVSWNLDYLPTYNDRATEFQKYCKNVLEYEIWPYSYPNELFTNGMITPELCIMDLDSISKNRLFEVIMISSDFEASWDDYIAYCNSSFNVDEAINEVTEKANELGIMP